MLSRLRLLLRYIWHGRTIYHIHSPFVYNFVKYVLRSNRHYYAFNHIKQITSQLKRSKQTITMNDLGAGSQTGTAKIRTLANLTRNTAIPAKYGRLLFRIINEYELKHVLELGTGTGVSALYMAAANQTGRIMSLEGNEHLAAVSRNTFKQAGYAIELVIGPFDKMLPQVLKNIETVDLAFLDGNHKREATLRYFEAILPHLHDGSVVVLDDINWSVEMMDTWHILKQHPKVKLSVDLYRMGLLFFNKDFREPQHIVLYY